MSKSLSSELAEQISSYVNDPLGFVLFAFEWGNGDLKAYPNGPDEWQREVLCDIADALNKGADLQSIFKLAIASGHGVGKSALVSWIILWAMATFPDTRGVVTANTENQLKTKTWAELAKWHRLCVCKDWFDCTATALISSIKGREKTWRIDMIPWSERNTEAFAGLHNQGRRLLLIFDEASAIPDVIWEVSEGALTDDDTQIIWCCFGNPTRNAGRFRECFGKFSHRWATKRIDSRKVKITNKKLIQTWVEDYGEDSDFVRVRVRGEFPRLSGNQFISHELVHNARTRSYPENFTGVRIMAVDVARFGGDQSVITKRCGLTCFNQLKYRGLDLMSLSNIIAKEYQDFMPQILIVDGIGIGAGVVDRLRQLGIDVIDAIAGSSAVNPAKFKNRRAEMWSKMREWLTHGAIPNDAELSEQLCGLQYGFSDKGALQLERKEDLKSRGQSSPDCADSLALTFYAPEIINSNTQAKAKTEYNILNWQ